MVQFFKPKQKEVSTKHFALTILDLDMKGRGVGKANNVTWFVKGALAGEEVIVRAIDVKKNIGNAELISIKRRSPARIKSICENSDKCGGCSLLHMTLEEELNAKVNGIKKIFKKQFGHVLIPIDAQVALCESGYRRVARLSIQADRKEFHIGFREAYGKKVVEIPTCPVMLESISKLITPLRAMYKHLSNFKLVGHIELVDAKPKPLVLFRCINKLTDADLELIRSFAKEQGVIAYTLTHYEKQKNELEDREVIEVLNPEALEGNEKPYYELFGLKVSFLPNDFIQINQQMNESLVKKALEYLALNDNDEVLDLFCGVGNFSLPIAQKAKHVYGIEGVWDMVKAGTLNAELNGLTNLEFCVHNLDEDFEKTKWANSKVTKALMDPGRSGGQKVVTYLAKRQIETIVYVSCNPLTLVRDLEVLLNKGYEIKKWSVFDMFPRTEHVEMICLLTRKDT